jgi:hypothetical protein
MRKGLTASQSRRRKQAFEGWPSAEDFQVGLLDKLNPRATRRSATAWAVGSGIVGGLGGFFGWLRSDMSFWAVFFVVPWMVVFCALGGWAIEWQIPSDCDEDHEPGAHATRDR